MTRKIDSSAMREANRAIVLDIIRQRKQVSRADLARISQLTKPTVSIIVESLVAEALVREIGFRTSVGGGGRPARLLELNPAAAAYVALHFGVDQTEASVSDACGELVDRIRGEAIVGNPAAAVANAKGMVATLLERHGIPAKRVRACGVAVPGLVDQETGACMLAPNLQWRDYPLREAVQDALRVETSVYNIAQAAAVAEAREGVARTARSFVWLYVGRGVGAGLVLDSRLYFGQQGYSGEIGHCPVMEDGPACGCGRRGCLESLVAAMAIERAAAEAVGAGVPTRLGQQQDRSVPAIIAAAEAGDGVARGILRDVGEHLGRGICYLLNLLNPELVVLSGSVIEAGELVLGPARVSAVRNALRPERVRIVRSRLGGEARLRGATLLAMDRDVHPR